MKRWLRIRRKREIKRFAASYGSLPHPLLISITVHAALFLAVLTIKPEGELTDTPHVIHVELVQLRDGRALREEQDHDGLDTGSTEPLTVEEPKPLEPATTLAGANATPPPGETVEKSQSAAPPVEPGETREPHESAPIERPDPRELVAEIERVLEAPDVANAEQVAEAEQVTEVERTAEAERVTEIEPTTEVERITDVERVAEVERPTDEERITDVDRGAEVDRAAVARAARAEPTIQRIAMRPPERSMLEKKIDEWTERFYKVETSEPSVTWEHKGQRYAATFTQLPAEGSMDLDEVVVVVSTEEGGNTLSTQMRMKRLAFSHFAQFVDRWDPEVQIHDDQIDGRFHSNTEIYVQNSGGVKPTFFGRVTTSRSVNTSYSTGRIARKDVFLGGLETGVRRILLPKHFLDGAAEAAPDDEQVRYFERDAQITFYRDGTYGWRDVESTDPEQREHLGDGPFYLMGAPKIALHVKGVVDGQVLVYSPEKIVIEDDLVYAADPTRATSDDFLGLVSDKSVEIAEPDTTGPGDLLIQASIYAKRRFVVRNFRSTEQGMLAIFGSLTAGSLTATEPRYSTLVQFDERLENLRPPSFPTTDRYELTTWDGRWTIEPNVADSASWDVPSSPVPE